MFLNQSISYSTFLIPSFLNNPDPNRQVYTSLKQEASVLSLNHEK